MAVTITNNPARVVDDYLEYYSGDDNGQLWNSVEYLNPTELELFKRRLESTLKYNTDASGYTDDEIKEKIKQIESLQSENATYDVGAGYGDFVVTAEAPDSSKPYLKLARLESEFNKLSPEAQWRIARKYYKKLPTHMVSNAFNRSVRKEVDDFGKEYVLPTLLTLGMPEIGLLFKSLGIGTKTGAKYAAKLAEKFGPKLAEKVSPKIIPVAKSLVKGAKEWTTKHPYLTALLTTSGAVLADGVIAQPLLRPIDEKISSLIPERPEEYDPNTYVNAVQLINPGFKEDQDEAINTATRFGFKPEREKTGGTIKNYLSLFK